MNGCRNAMGWASQASGPRISKIRSVRSQVAVSRAFAVDRSSTVSIMGDLLCHQADCYYAGRKQAARHSAESHEVVTPGVPLARETPRELPSRRLHRRAHAANPARERCPPWTDGDSQ